MYGIGGYINRTIGLLTQEYTYQQNNLPKNLRLFQSMNIREVLQTRSNRTEGKRCDNNGVAPLTRNGITHVDDQSQIDNLNKQFSSVFSSDVNPAPDLGYSNVPRMADIEIGRNGVDKLLGKLKPH